MLTERRLFIVDKVSTFKSCGNSFLPASAAAPEIFAAYIPWNREERVLISIFCSVWTIFSDSMYVNT